MKSKVRLTCTYIKLLHPVSQKTDFTKDRYDENMTDVHIHSGYVVACLCGVYVTLCAQKCSSAWLQVV